MQEMRKIQEELNDVDSYIDNLIVYKNDWKAQLQVLQVLFLQLLQEIFTTLFRFYNVGVNHKKNLLSICKSA